MVKSTCNNRNGYKPVPRIKRQCWCGNWFEGIALKKYCSYECRQVTRMVSCSLCDELMIRTRDYDGDPTCKPCRIKRKADQPTIEVHTCLRCWGTWSRPATKGQRPKHCPDCRVDTRAWIPRAVRFSVYERDGWVCQICSDPVDSGLIGTMSVWRPSLDHVVPRVAGGSDDPSNLRIAHFWCNGVLNDGRAYCEEDFRTPV